MGKLVKRALVFIAPIIVGKIVDSVLNKNKTKNPYSTDKRRK